MEHWQAALDGGQIANPRRIQPQSDHQRRHKQDRRQGRGKRRCDLWNQPDHDHCQAHKTQHGVELHALHPLQCAIRPFDLELAKLSQKDHDGQAVYKAQHHRVRDQPDEPAQMEQPSGDLNDPHQNDSGEQVFNAMLRNQRDHDDRQGPCGA